MALIGSLISYGIKRNRMQFWMQLPLFSSSPHGAVSGAGETAPTALEEIVALQVPVGNYRLAVCAFVATSDLGIRFE